MAKKTFYDVLLASRNAAPEIFTAAHKVIAKQAGVIHPPVNVAAGQRVVGSIYHIQNANTYNSRFKQWMDKFHGVATRYLKSYLSWHRTIDHLVQSIKPTACFLSSIGRMTISIGNSDIALKILSAQQMHSFQVRKPHLGLRLTFWNLLSQFLPLRRLY